MRVAEHEAQGQFGDALDAGNQVGEGLVGAAQAAPGHGTHDDDAHAFFRGIGNSFLELAVEQVVLQGDGLVETGLGDAAKTDGVVVERGADVLDETLVFGRGQPLANARLHGFGEALPVDAMGVVDVDAVDLQPLQAVFQILPPGFFVVAVVGILGGDIHFSEPSLEGIADGPLAVLVAIADSGVHVVQAAGKGAVEHGDGQFAVDAIPFHGEAHAAATEARYSKAGLAQYGVLHTDRLPF